MNTQHCISYEPNCMYKCIPLPLQISKVEWCLLRDPLGKRSRVVRLYGLGFY